MELEEDGACDFAIVEVGFDCAALAIGNDLLGFVAFAGDDDDVAWGCVFDGEANGVVAFDMDVHFVAVFDWDADEDFINNCAGSFAARVVAGNDHAIGKRDGGEAHARSLGAISIATAAEDNPEARGRVAWDCGASGVDHAMGN